MMAIRFSIKNIMRTIHQLPRLFFLVALGFFLSETKSHAHIGVQNVFLETRAGPYPIRVTIKPPEVVPGLAEIYIRVHDGNVTEVTALPVRYDSGREGAPPPDRATAVPGSPGLFQAELWFMRSGAHSVVINLSGPDGEGEAMVPFDAIATRTLPLPRILTFILTAMATLLVLLAASIVGGAVRDAVVPAGSKASNRRLWGARLAYGIQLILILALIYTGKNWWDAEELEYQNNRLYRPMTAEATLSSDSSEAPKELTVTISDPRFRQGSPLLPDHGKLMHLFMIETESRAFAHLHPTRSEWEIFKTAIPDLPAGQYRIFADITHETGFSHTLTNLITLPPPAPQSSSFTSSDIDDSWMIEASDQIASPPLIEIHRLQDKTTVSVNEEIALQFSVRTIAGAPVNLEPYMGMKSHLVIQKRDGTVFSHLHPSGNVSMASLQAFETRITSGRPQKVARGQIDPFCELPSVEQSTQRWWQLENRSPEADLSFPYAFPRPGDYRLWVQVKHSGTIVTRSFDITITPAQ